MDIRRAEMGFSLIELLVLIVVIGVLAAIAMQSMTTTVEDTRRVQTERALEQVSNAIVGDPEKMQDGIRSDFGYVGDIGAFPSSLAALYTNPGLALWKGPYVQVLHAEDTVSFRTDAWGAALSYSGGTTVSSNGHGSAITKKICDSTTDYLLNTVVGSVRDKNDSTPGLIKKDSVSILVDIPSGGSGLVTRSYTPLASGAFSCDSVPAGKRYFRFIYKPGNDTLRKYYTVLPRHQGTPQLLAKFAGAYFTGAASGPIAYWRFDEGSGAVANDSCSPGYTGALTNMNTATAWVAGKHSGALTFDGTNDCVIVGSAFPHITALTVMAWVKPSSNGVDRQIVSKGFNGTRTEWELKTTTAGGNVSIRHWAPGAVGVESLHSLTVGAWTHVAGTYDGTTWKIYWNGVLDNQAVNTAPVATTNRLCIGAVDINGSPGQFWAGAIDDVRVYDRALSAAEIAALAQ